MKVIQPEWLWSEEGLRENWCISIHSDTIVGVEPTARHSDIVETLPGVLVVPGFVNAHSHAFQRAFRGQVQWRGSEQDDFWSWRTAMYEVANGLSPEGVEAVSKLAFMEMVEAGFTWVGEFHYLHHQADGQAYDDPEELARRVIAAATSVGIRLTLLRVAYARNSPGQPLGPMQLRFGDSTPDAVLQAVSRLSSEEKPMVSVGLAPHSVRAVPPEWLSDFASYPGIVHMHVAEQPAEVSVCRSETGLAPLAAVEQAGLLSDRFTAVHMTVPEDGDDQRMNRTGARICICPTTELDLGDGFLPLHLRQTVPLCIGSDSQAMIDPFAEIRAIEMHGRGQAGLRNLLAPVNQRHGLAEHLLRAGSIEGQRALGGPGLGLCAGAPADFIGIDLRRPGAWGVPPLEAAVFGATPDWVTDVWIGGQRRVREGRHIHRDAIQAEVIQWLT